MRAPILLLAAAGLAACSTVPADDATQPVALSFELTSAGRPAVCGKPLGPLGTAKTAAKLHDARFYVQDVALLDAAGKATPVKLTQNQWQNGPTALLDFEDASGGCVGTPALNKTVAGMVPPGKYVGASFTVGVPPTQNHSSVEKAGAPLDSAAMAWSWQAGRKFIKIEVDPKGGVRKPDGTKAPTWFLHLGSTECAGNPAKGETASCKRSNRVPVVFPAFDPATQAVRLDLASLFAASNIAKDQGAAVGCMSAATDADCPPVFGRLGLSLETGQPVEPGKSPAFTAVKKP